MSVVHAQNDKISFSETTHDFGTIIETGGNVSCNFVVTNNSDAPLIITNVSASCGCTTPQWTREPIEPGKTGSVTATYSPVGRVAPFTKTITVSTNLSSPITLRIKGEVVKGVVTRQPGKDYVVKLGDYLLKTQNLDFKSVAPDEVKIVRLEVFNNSEIPVTQSVNILPKSIAVTFNPTIVPPKTEATIDVSFDAKTINQFGKFKGEVNILINGVSHAFPYSAIILDDFSKWTATKKAQAGKINASFSELTFGNFSKKNDTRTVKLSNSGKSRLNIKNIQSESPLIKVSKTILSIEPGEIAELKVSIDGKKVKSDLNTVVAIISDDPKTPVYEITVTAKP
jgi:hypothetical protein